MRKKIIALLLNVSCLAMLGCGKIECNTVDNALRVGLITDSGVVDDGSFNEGAWTGLLNAGEDGNISSVYLRPVNASTEEYMLEIDNLYNNGYKFIVAPSFQFSNAIYQAQNKYTDANFVILDAVPEDDNGNENISENTVSILYNEHEGGFLAGVAAAVELKSAKFGFIGGMEVSAVQKFNWGFQQGVRYANEHLGTNIELNPENVIYEGSFINIENGKNIASDMYDNGVDVIFAAAGSVGLGVIEEAKERASKGEDVWVIGVDVDQYEEGLYDDNKSVILTSATKSLASAVYDMVKLKEQNMFEGGQIIHYSAGIPDENPNLSSETIEIVKSLSKKIINGELTVNSEQGDLIK